jgi:glutamate racemase
MGTADAHTTRDGADDRDGDRRPIGVFDSGVGGLTVMRSLIDLLPRESFVYFGDTGRTPYGPKPPDDVIKYSIEITDLLAARGVKLVVDACNTSTAVALDTLRERVEVPVVGVIEPGLRAAARATRSGRVGVIGTVGTVDSGAYERVARAVTPDIDLVAAACPGFVEFVEAGDVESHQVHVLAQRLLAPVIDARVDTLILGCTHYPLLARTISDVMGPDVVLVSSADETAFGVRDLLASDGAHAPHDNDVTHDFLTSGSTERFAHLGVRFLGPEVASVQGWQW